MVRPSRLDPTSVLGAPSPIISVGCASRVHGDLSLAAESLRLIVTTVLAIEVGIGVDIHACVVHDHIRGHSRVHFTLVRQRLLILEHVSNRRFLVLTVCSRHLVDYIVAGREIYCVESIPCRASHLLVFALALSHQALRLAEATLVSSHRSHLRRIVWVEKNKSVQARHGQVADKQLDIVVKLLQNKTSTLVGNLHHNTLRLLYVECGDKHGGLARADLNYVIASAHSFAFLVQDDTVFVQNARLPIQNIARLKQLFQVRIISLWTYRESAL